MDFTTLMVHLFLCTAGVALAANLTYMEDTLRNYFADVRHHQANPVYKARAKSFIFEEFKRFGLETYYHDFVYFQGNFSNIVGIKRGVNFGSTADKILGVVAHYDTVNISKGVDDNGAGVVAMLEALRQINLNKFQHTIIFLSPDLEETDLTGSRKFIDDWLPQWVEQHYGDVDTVKANVQGCIVMDTMMEYNTSANSQTIPEGSEDLFKSVFPEVMADLEDDSYEGDFLLLIYRVSNDHVLADEFSRSWVSEGRSEFEIEKFGLPDNSLPVLSDFLRSDHYNFWNADIPAVFLTDSANFRGDMIQCYHRRCDNVEVMLTQDNIRFLAKTADTIVRTVNNRMGPVASGDSRCQACIYTVALVLLMCGLLKDLLLYMK